MNASITVDPVKSTHFTGRFLKTVSEKGFQITGSILLGGITLLIVVNVIFRYIFNNPLSFSIELVEMTLSMIVFWGIAICTSRKGHVAIDVVVNRFSPKVQSIINSIIYFLITDLFVIMTWRFFNYALNSQESVTNIFRLPVFAFILVIGITSITITLTFFTQFIELLKRSVSR